MRGNGLASVELSVAKLLPGEVQASTGIEEVNQNVGQGNSVAMAIARDIAEVNQSTVGIAQRSSQIKSISENLAALAEKLSLKVGQFRV